MPKLSALLDDFHVGEISPLYEARIASDEYKDGVREATNMRPDSRGPLVGRNGFAHTQAITGITSGEGATIIGVSYDPDVRFRVILYDSKILAYDQDGNKILDSATSYTEADLHGANSDEHLVQAFMDPDGTVMHILVDGHAPSKVTFTSGSPWTAAFATITFSNAPAAWAGTNYPTTGGFFGGRSWWGGCPDDPDTFWGSNSLDYYEMDLGTGNDDEGIEFPIAKHGRILWIVGGRSLLIGTTNGEYVVTPSASAITPSNVGIELQSTYGSANIQPYLVNNEVFYVSGDRRKLRSLWWRVTESGWMSSDATFTAEHMTYEEISRVAFTRNPHNALWILLKDGSLASCVHKRDDDKEATVGWYRISSDHLYFRDISVVENNGSSELVAIASSKATGDTQYFEVVMSPGDYHDDEEIFLDNYSVYDGAATDTPNFAGVLFDSEIAVVADGFYIPDVTIDGGGDIALPAEYSRIIVGHPYSMKVETLPFVLSASGVSPVSYQQKRWSMIWLKMVSSYMPKVNDYRPAERHASTLNDTPESFIDQFVQVAPGFGYDRTGSLVIEQDLPFRFILTGIYGEIDIEAA